MPPAPAAPATAVSSPALVPTSPASPLRSSDSPGCDAAARNLFRLHGPPPGWWWATTWILLGDAVVIVACIGIGRWLFDDAHELFRERRPGTFASVAVLVCSGLSCFRIRKRVAGSPVAAFWLAFGVVMCVAGADDLFRLHEHLDKIFHRLT